MEYIISFIINFIINFVLIYLLYYFLFIRNSRRKEKVPAEAQFLISTYKLDTKLFSYQKFIRTVGIITCLDISLVTTIISVVDGLVWQILFGFAAVIPICVISFMMLGKHYKKKEQQDNSKELKQEKEYLDKIDNKNKKKKHNEKKGSKKNGNTKNRK